MPRTARLDIPGQLYHINARGVERCDIFRDDIDRSSFCDRLSALLFEADWACLKGTGTCGASPLSRSSSHHVP